MKKIILLAAIAGIAFVSCKKDRTCTCTDSVVSRTSTQPGYTYTPQPATTSSTKYSKNKKEKCFSPDLRTPRRNTNIYSKCI